MELDYTKERDQSAPLNSTVYTLEPLGTQLAINDHYLRAFDLRP